MSFGNLAKFKRFFFFFLNDKGFVNDEWLFNDKGMNGLPKSR